MSPLSPFRLFSHSFLRAPPGPSRVFLLTFDMGLAFDLRGFYQASYAWFRLRHFVQASTVQNTCCVPGGCLLCAWSFTTKIFTNVVHTYTHHPLQFRVNRTRSLSYAIFCQTSCARPFFQIISWWLDRDNYFVHGALQEKFTFG